MTLRNEVCRLAGFLMIALAAAQPSSSVARANVTYTVNINITSSDPTGNPLQSDTVAGTITTDGTIGTILAHNIKSWDLRLIDLLNSANNFELTTANSEVVEDGDGAGQQIGGGGLTATASGLFFDFSNAKAEFGLQASDALYSGYHYFCLSSGLYACAAGESISPNDISTDGVIATGTAAPVGNQPLNVPTLARAGALAHIAAGGPQWTTTITIFNPSTSSAAVSVVFHQDDGSIPAAMSVTTTQQGITQAVSGGTVNATLNPNASLLISAGDPSQPLVAGWADVLSSGSVAGFAIFQSAVGTPSEGTVPLQTQLTSTLVLPYDNTNGFVMGVALANLSSSSATITATMWDDGGNSLGSQPIAIAGSGHASFVLTTQLPATAGKRGIIRFESDGTGGLSGIGLRFSPLGTFTSVPTVPQ